MGLFDTTWSLQVEKLLPPVLRDKIPQEKDGDFKLGNPENEYIHFILISSPGHWKEFPIVGVGIYNYLQSTESPQALAREILVQLKNDVFPKPTVNVRSFPTIIVNSTIVKVE